jgi:hypothetical protein
MKELDAKQSMLCKNQVFESVCGLRRIPNTISKHVTEIGAKIMLIVNMIIVH